MKFYLNVCENGRTYRDPIGAEFATLDIAKTEAVKSLGEMLQPRPQEQAFAIIIEDAHAREMCMIELNLTIHNSN